MLSSLILQLMIDILLLSVVGWFWIQQKRILGTTPKNGGITHWEKTINEYEKKLCELRQSFEEERRKTQVLHDRIEKLIDQGALTSTIFPMSQEEEELKSLQPRTKPEVKIPTIKQIEITRERLDKETSIDLRTILRDQLA